MTEEDMFFIFTSVFNNENIIDIRHNKENNEVEFILHEKLYLT